MRDSTAAFLLLAFAPIFSGCHAVDQARTDQAPRVPVTTVAVRSTQVDAVILAGEPVGARFRARFQECDSSSTCDGERLKYGCARDPNRNSYLLRLKGGAIAFNAKMGLDADGSAYSLQKKGVDQPETSLRYPMRGSPSIKSDHVPFIVIPLGGFDDELGVGVGDVAAVTYRDMRVFAIVADKGPKCKIGEGSIKLHEMLDHRVCLDWSSTGDCTKIRDIGIERGVSYIIFPGTKEKLYDGLTPENINQRIEAVGEEAWTELDTSPP
ncbi:hypothetical protein [Pseudoxanthomonas mexicana]